MKKQIVATILAAVFIGCAGVAYGHHSFDAYFLTDETTTVEGVVTEFWFANPHARIYLEVTNADGELVEWMAEGGSRNVLTRRGWSADTIKPGMELVVQGSPSRDGSNAIGWRSLTTVDGTEVGP
jgi:hypothetical protein